MDILTYLAKWAALQGASWLLRHRGSLLGFIGLVSVAALLVGAGLGASVSAGGADEQARATCRTMGFDVASAPGGAEAGYVPAPVDAVLEIPEGGAVDGFGPGESEQIAVAQAIIAAGYAAGVGTRGLVIAIATALQESGLRELNYGDRDSLGPFQQRPSQGWGTPEQVTDAGFAARAFFGGPASPHFRPSTGRASPGGLLEIDGWMEMPVTVAAQKVQRSAFPNAYAKHEARATRILAALTGAAGPLAAPMAVAPTRVEMSGAASILSVEDYRSSGFDIDAFCAANVAGDQSPATADGEIILSGSWTAPLTSPITSEFGMRLHPVHRVWKLHAGTDFQATVGTPLRAASDGVVTTVTWYGGGGLIVAVEHADEAETWFLHLSQVLVRPGDVVAGGEVIALSGNTGVATGPHFHLETHVRGVPVDPVAFFRTRGVELTVGQR
ncbi:M23 family metallopeptidase [Cellulomonas sp. NPDC055163]